MIDQDLLNKIKEESNISKKFIILHHSASDFGCLSEIDKWHSKRWSRAPLSGLFCGYNFIINNGFPSFKSWQEKRIENEWLGKIERARYLREPSAHCVGFNSNGIGICVVGNYDKYELHEVVFQKLINFLDFLIEIFKVDPKNVLGHWETFILSKRAKDEKEAKEIKSCPGKFFPLKRIRDYLAD